MANVDRPNGFKPVKSLIGAPWSALVRNYPVAASQTTGIFIGDVVKLTAGNVEQAASGDTILGVVVATGKDSTEHGEAGYFNADQLEQRHIPADTAGIAGVVPAEACTFEAQTAADLDLVQGSAADILVGTGDTITGNSATELTTSINGDCKVVEHNRAPDNDITLTNARHIVQFTTTEHTL
jgi:hypothetical protein